MINTPSPNIGSESATFLKLICLLSELVTQVADVVGCIATEADILAAPGAPVVRLKVGPLFDTDIVNSVASISSLFTDNTKYCCPGTTFPNTVPENAIAISCLIFRFFETLNLLVNDDDRTIFSKYDGESIRDVKDCP